MARQSTRPAGDYRACCGALSLTTADRTVPALGGAAELASALAEPARLGLLCALRGGERSMTELVEATGLGRANATKHVRELRRLGLVRRRRDGRKFLYRPASERVYRLFEIVWKDLEEEVGRAAG